MDKKLTRIKQQISRLDYGQLSELSNYLAKKKNDAWKNRRAQEAKDHDFKIIALPRGSKLVFTDSRYDLCGKIGIKEKDLSRGSTRTVVVFGTTRWTCPRKDLSTDLREENIRRLKAAHAASAALSGIFNKAVGDQKRDLRPYCCACGWRIDKGKSKRFKGKYQTFTMHKFRKDCDKKSSWSRTRKQQSGKEDA